MMAHGGIGKHYRVAAEARRFVRKAEDRHITAAKDKKFRLTVMVIIYMLNAFISGVYLGMLLFRTQDEEI